MSHPSSQPMSLEAMMDEERREVLALLEGSTHKSVNSSPVMGRSSSPYMTARSPIRSMLDINDPSSNSRSSAASTKSPPRQAPVRSMLDISTPPPAPSALPIRSMLDIDTPPSHNGLQPPGEVSRSRASSISVARSPRSLSDASSRPPDFSSLRSSAGRADPANDYQFSGFLPSTGHALPKRNTLSGKLGAGIGESLRWAEGTSTGPDRGRQTSMMGSRMAKSKSPHGRAGNRSHSPYTAGQLAPGMAMLDDGRIVDITHAYRRLSDANLASSGGSLARLATRKRSEDGRLTKDYIHDQEMGDSSDDPDSASSDEENERGRKRQPRTGADYADGRSVASSSSKSPVLGRDGDRKARSLLAAAEEERISSATKPFQYQYRSMLEPDITVTNPSGVRSRPSKNVVHPSTSYDQGPESGAVSAMNSEDEADVNDIVRAQKLSFSMTPIITSGEHHRAIRIIYRGDYQKVVAAAEEEHHNMRKYLVATDLSEESNHALEWAIGTVLRDGDTLVAICCVDEEAGLVGGESPGVPDDKKAMKEEAAAIHAVTETKAPPVATTVVSTHPTIARAQALQIVADQSAPATATTAGEPDKGSDERLRAVQQITDKVVKLLRKTRLQVRVMVEVLHCKNPRHLITEVIDLVNPTLVILGSRGRSALKGVILGSFSNYLVTKSSVPVMVARKRLRKQSKYKTKPQQQVNNLSNPTARKLANAKVD